MESADILDALFERLAAPPSELAAFVENLLAKARLGFERRTAERFPLAYPVLVVPIDDQTKTSTAFAAITRDVSSTGLSMFHTHPVYEPYLAVQFATETGEKFRVLVEVIRCQPKGLFFEIAGSFVTEPLRG